MGYDARVDSLRSKHAEVDAALVLESRRPQPDADALRDLKRQKLFLKDEIERMSRH